MELLGLNAVNTNDESVGFLIGAISGNTGEDGTSAEFTVRLTSQPGEFRGHLT